MLKKQKFYMYTILCSGGVNSPRINFQISGHTVYRYVYLYHFNVKNSIAFHDGFMVFAKKMFQESYP